MFIPTEKKMPRFVIIIIEQYGQNRHCTISQVLYRVVMNALSALKIDYNNICNNNKYYDNSIYFIEMKIGNPLRLLFIKMHNQNGMQEFNSISHFVFNLNGK